MIVNDQLSSRGRINCGADWFLRHFSDRFPIGGDLWPTERAQLTDCSALDLVRFPIQDEPALFERVKQRQIDNSFQTSALIHSPKKRHFLIPDQLSAGENLREMGVVLQTLDERVPFALRSLRCWGCYLMLIEGLFPRSFFMPRNSLHEVMPPTSIQRGRRVRY